MDLASAITPIATPVVERQGGFLVEVSIRGERGTRIVEIFIDSDTGVTADLCAAVSREISAELDAREVIQGRYRLDISSPGIDRPLKFIRQYKKNIGRTLKVHYADENEAKITTGTLRLVNDTQITLESENQTLVAIPLTAIRKAVVEPQWK